MPKIKWDDSLSVNNDEIDSQHKEWIGIFNKMHDTIMTGNVGAVRNIGVNTLREMQDYARYHFSFEEEYMRTMNYPRLYEHQRAHKDFDNTIYSYMRDIQSGEMVLNSEIMELIRSWLFDHIAIEDKKYAAHLKTKEQ